MPTRRVLMGALLAGILVSGSALPARAVEYRLEVVNLWETALYAYAAAAELHDGASGPGLERFQASLDDATMSRGVVLGDRTLRWASESVARAYGTTRVLAEIHAGGDGHPLWDEVRWDGKPGERSVWMVLPSGRGRPERLYRAVLKGDGPPRQFLAYVPTRGTRSAAVKYPLAFLWAYESRGTVWQRYVSGSIDLSQGIGAVVGENDNQSLPDTVYLIIEQGAQPTTYKAMLLWREPAYNQQAPSNPAPMPK
jgi:hypothetical protein